MENPSKNRPIGYYVTLIATLLSLLTSVVYITAYGDSDYLSWPSFVLLAAAVLMNIVFLLIRKKPASPLVTGLLTTVAYMFYFYGMYFYISVVMVGIDLNTFEPKFVITTILFSLVFVIGIANVFLPQGEAMDGVKTSRKIYAAASAVLLSLLCLSSAIVKENSGAISAFLGSKTYKIIESDETDMDTGYFKSNYDNLADLMSAGVETARRAEAEGVVLLKNNGHTLPLTGDCRNISLFGITSVDPVYGGTGSGAVDTATAPTFREAMEEGGFSVNQALWDFYDGSCEEYGREELRSADAWFSRGYTINEVPWNAVEAGAGSSFAQFGDAAVFIVGRVGGEGADTAKTNFEDPTATDGNYLKLSVNEIDVLKGLAALKGTAFDRIIVLINSANQVETDFLNDPAYKIDAALWIGSVGQMGLPAVADIMSGSVVPSGRLSDMFWNNHDLNPVHANFGTYAYGGAEDYDLSDGFSKYVVYQEGIYLGYRYGETRYEDVITGRENAGDFNYAAAVTYPFGYGLSYTDFAYGNYSVIRSEDGRTYTASVDVTNTGREYSGKEVVQFYVQKPYTDYDIEQGIEKASVDLVQFAKTGILAPGETETVTVEIDGKYFASYDVSGAGTYILDEGDYYVAAGKNAHDALNNILAARGYGESDGMDAPGDASLTKSFRLDFDDTSYAVSEATGQAITNLFDFADPNRLPEAGENEVRYLSRNNWEKTVVLDKNVQIELNQAMVDTLKDQTAPLPEDDVAYPAYGVPGGLNLIDMRVDSESNPIPFDDPLWDTFMDQLTWDDTAYLLTTGLRKTGAIETVAKPETLDHNGPSGLTQPYSAGPLGLATLTNDPDKSSQPMCYPSNGIIASTFNPELAGAIGEMIGEDALWAGYSGLYGTGANMHRSPYEGRAFEYYSEDPFLSGVIVARESSGIQSRGCYVYLKHFVLNDQENGRMGIGTWTNEQALREIYMRAFEIPIVEGGAKNVMEAFNRVGLIAAPNSSVLMEDFLRGELGMDGFTVTDYYGAYGSILNRPNTVLAGTDLPDGDIDPAKTFDDYKAGYGELARAMRLSAKRILYTVVHSNAMNGISPNTTIVTVTPGYIIALNAAIAVFALLFLASAAMLVLAGKKKN